MILKKRNFLFINVAISGDRNVIKNGTENILNNRNLTIAIERTWTVKTKEIPVVTGAIGPSQNRS